jgi:hypothetical protein
MPLARRCVRSKLAALAVGVVFAGACTPAQPPPQTAAPAPGLEAPVLFLSVQSGTRRAHSWRLHVWADGRAALEWGQRDPALNNTYRIWREELDVGAERVAAIMEDAYERLRGAATDWTRPSDSGEERLVVRDGSRLASAQIRWINLYGVDCLPADFLTPERQESMAQAIELCDEIQSLFEEPPSVSRDTRDFGLLRHKFSAAEFRRLVPELVAEFESYRASRASSSSPDAAR